MAWLEAEQQHMACPCSIGEYMEKGREVSGASPLGILRPFFIAMRGKHVSVHE